VKLSYNLHLDDLCSLDVSGRWVTPLSMLNPVWLAFPKPRLGTSLYRDDIPQHHRLYAPRMCTHHF
jgi:hypothetical protein